MSPGLATGMSDMNLRRLFEATANRGDWVRDAKCRGLDPGMFFASRDGNRGRGGNVLTDKARAICAECPVREPCRDFALDAHEVSGVWGGFAFSSRTERAAARRLRAEGRAA